MRKSIGYLFDEIYLWRRGWLLYAEKRIKKFGIRFENNKSLLVDILMARRGTYQRPFLHFSLGIIFVAGVMGAPILASSQTVDTGSVQSPSAAFSTLDFTEYGVQTEVSQKPRDQVVKYTVVDGDTLSTIADKFGVSVNTVKWANNITRDALSIGQGLDIPPVSGIVHKVKEGETVYSIAKKYKTDPQKIVNFPFNDFSDLETFALNVGQTLIVPDGVAVTAVPVASTIPIPPVISGGTGQFIWPTSGGISQYPIWYHMAVDIANPKAPAIMAADGGVVTLVEYGKFGYGFHIIIQHGDGLSTLYGHMQEMYVKAGDQVSRGQVIGRMGSTGRSTGTHLHFEVRKNNVLLNPLSFLK